MRQKAKITFEMEETVVLKRGRKSVTGLCPQCRMHVEMIAPDVLALLSGSSEREIFRMIEAGCIHFIEQGRVLACASCYRELTTDQLLSE